MEIAALLAEEVPGMPTSDSPVERITYARDLWPRHHLAVRAGRIAEHKPALVVWPRDVGELSGVVRACAREGTPLAPFGAGSGVCAGVLPNERTVVVDMKRMDKIRAIDRDRWLLDVDAGALGVRLEEDLDARGFTLGHFPSSILCSTVGGWIAARSAGQCSGKYGKIEDMVAEMECVLGDGEIVRLSRRVHGPDVTPLVVGSEGTLAIVARAKLRLHPKPSHRGFAAFSFPSIEAGWSAMREMFQAGLRPAVARLYDPFDSFIARMGRGGRKKGEGKKSETKRGAGGGALALRSLLRAPKLLNEIVDALGTRVLKGSTLVLVFEGVEEENAADLARAVDISRRLGAKDLGEAPARHWLEHRYAVSYRQAPVFMSGAFSDTMEVAARWSNLAALYEGVRAALGDHVFVMAHLSHAYPDGCSIYFTFAGSAASDAECERKYDAAWRAALDAAIAAGGTLSHHHGVGRSKAPKLGAEVGAGVDVVRALQHAFDPSGVLNPGNLLPRGPFSRPEVPDAPRALTIDATSMLVEAPGDATLGAIEAALRASGMSLRLSEEAPRDASLARWIAEGARGAPDPWLDPVDHLVAGFTARLASGTRLHVRAAPRRAVGPDLFALFLGAREKAGVVEAATLRAHRGAEAPRPLACGVERDPPTDAGERALIERALAAAAGVE